MFSMDSERLYAKKLKKNPQSSKLHSTMVAGSADFMAKIVIAMLSGLVYRASRLVYFVKGIHMIASKIGLTLLYWDGGKMKTEDITFNEYITFNSLDTTKSLFSFLIQRPIADEEVVVIDEVQTKTKGGNK